MKSGKIFKKKFLCIKTFFRAHISNLKKEFFPTFWRGGGGLPPSGKIPTYFFLFLMNPSLYWDWMDLERFLYTTHPAGEQRQEGHGEQLE